MLGNPYKTCDGGFIYTLHVLLHNFTEGDIHMGLMLPNFSVLFYRWEKLLWISLTLCFVYAYRHGTIGDGTKLSGNYDVTHKTNPVQIILVS